MDSVVRDSILGQIIRFASGNRLLLHPEERPGFKIPWEEAAALEKTDSIAIPPADTPPSSDHTDEKPPAAFENGSSNPLILSKVSTQVSTRSEGIRSFASRTRSREQTAPFSAERHDVEQAEAVERAVSNVIQPTKTADGVILVDWYTTDDPENPQNWSSGKKVFVCMQIFLYTLVVYAASAIYTSSVGGVMERFDVSQTKASLGLSMYVIGYGVGPLIFSPLSEVPLLGRNIPYISSFILFVILGVPTALVDNYAGLLVLRFLTGFMGSPCLATGGATMQDMYSLLKLPYALTAWVAAAFSAPALGPLLSGFAVMNKNWRWSLWEILWMSAPVCILMFVALPETSSSNILLHRAQRLRKLTGNNNLRSQSEIDQGNMTFTQVASDQLIKPAEIMIKDPAVLFTNIYTSFIYGIYYSFFEVFPIVYVDMYGFNIGELGIVFIVIIVGCVVGIVIYVSYNYWYLEPDIKAHGLRAQEHRLVPAMFAITLMPAGLFWFGWTAEPSIHWIVPTIGITLFPIGAFVVFQCIFMYLPLTYPTYAASLFAANDTCRSALAAGAIVFAHPLYVNLGVGRGTSLLAGLMCGGVLGLWVLYFQGAKLRAKSRFAMS